MIRFSFYALTLIVSGFVLISCGGIKPLVDEHEEFSISKPASRITAGQVTVDLYNLSESDTTVSSIDYQYYTFGGVPYEDSVNCLIKHFIQINTDLDESIMENCMLSRAFMVAQLDSFADVYREELDNQYDFGTWSLSIDVAINEGFKEFIELQMFAWSFSGGAHGNGYGEVFLVDKLTGRTIWLEDMFSDINALYAIAEPIFRESQGLTEDEDLYDAGFWFSEGKFHLNDNFVFSNGNVTFMFDPYEISSYAADPIDLSIPISDIKHLLKRSID